MGNHCSAWAKNWPCLHSQDWYDRQAKERDRESEHNHKLRFIRSLISYVENKSAKSPIDTSDSKHHTLVTIVSVLAAFTIAFIVILVLSARLHQSEMAMSARLERVRLMELEQGDREREEDPVVGELDYRGM